MEKPTKKTVQFYDYVECSNHLQKKYSYDERNYAGKKFNGKKDDAPYQDFWHFVLYKTDLGNDSYFTMDNSWLKDAKEPWQKEILERYLSEFGEGKDREICFHVWW